MCLPLNRTDWNLVEEDNEETDEEIGDKGLLTEGGYKLGEDKVKANLVAIRSWRVVVKMISNNNDGRYGGAVMQGLCENWNGSQVRVKMDAFGIILVCIAGVSLEGKKRRTQHCHNSGDKATSEFVEGNETASLSLGFWKKNSGLGMGGTISATSSLHSSGEIYRMSSVVDTWWFTWLVGPTILSFVFDWTDWVGR